MSITQELIDEAFKNTHFGSDDHKGILLNGVKKTALNFHNGWTLTQIIRRLGLGEKSKSDEAANDLTKLGLEFIIQCEVQAAISQHKAVQDEGEEYRVTMENTPLYKQAYDLIQDIEALGCSPELTAVVTKAGKLTDEIVRREINFAHVCRAFNEMNAPTRMGEPYIAAAPNTPDGDRLDDEQVAKAGYVGPDYRLRACLCGSYDVGGAYSTVNCYKCHKSVNTDGFQESIDYWNEINTPASPLTEGK